MKRLLAWLRRWFVGPPCHLTPGCDGAMIDQGMGGDRCSRCGRWDP